MKGKKAVKIAAGLCLLIYAGYLAMMVADRTSVHGFWHEYNFVPFRSIGGYLSHWQENEMNRDIILRNLLGNLALLAPLGLLLPAFLDRWRRFGRIFCLSLFLSTLFEGFQYVTSTGVCDIDDVILNVTGACLGFGLYLLWERLWEQTRAQGEKGVREGGGLKRAKPL